MSHTRCRTMLILRILGSGEIEYVTKLLKRRIRATFRFISRVEYVFLLR